MTLLLAAVVLSCAGRPAMPSEITVPDLGAIDELIGPAGPTAAGFVDADYVQLRHPDDIPPIYAPQFVPAARANLPDDEPVIGLSVNGDSRAYPAGILYRREIVNDVIGGIPTLVSWCPLCYTALAHDRRLDGTTITFGNQGALYKGAMTWYDHDTGSIWAQPYGQAIAGPRAARTLARIPAQLTTWGEWQSAHPDTLALSVSEPALPYRGRLPGEQHVVGIVIGDAAAAWPYNHSRPLAGRVGEIEVVIWRDAATGAIRAARTTVPPYGWRELPVIIAYRQAWERLYPGTLVE